MADFQLPQKTLSNPGRTGGLRADMINGQAGGSIATARIDPAAARINFNPANVPTAVKDQTSAGIQHFMGATAEAAFKFQDRESTYFANKSIVDTDAMFQEVLNGSQDENGKNIPGYLSTKGANASTSFGIAQGQLESIAEESLNALEPRVREKATIRVTDAKNSAMNIASKHRVQQLEVAEEAVKYDQMKSLTALAGQDFRRLFTPDQHGKTFKDRVYGDIFEDPQKADKAWFGMLHGTMQAAIYNAPDMEQGVIIARGMYNSYMSKEFAGSFPDQKQAQDLLNTTDKSNQRFKWAEDDRNEKLALKADEERYEANQDDITNAELRGMPHLTPVELQGLVDTDTVSRGYAKSYTAAYHSGLYNHDYEEYTSVQDRLIAGEDVPSIEITRNPKIHPTFQKELLDLQLAVSDPNFRDQFDKHMDVAKANVERGNDFELFGGPDREAEWLRDAALSIRAWDKAGKSEKEINELIETNYSFKAITRKHATPLVAPGTEVQVYPESHEQIDLMNKTVQGAPDDYISQDEKMLFAEKAEKWHKILVAEDVPLDPQDRTTQAIDKQLELLDEKSKEDAPVLGEGGLTVESERVLETVKDGLNEAQVQEITAQLLRKDKLAVERAETVRQEKLQRDKDYFSTLTEDSDLAEVTALLNSDAESDMDKAVFLAGYRKNRRKQLQSAVVSARRARRLLNKKDPSMEQLEAADAHLASMEAAQQSEMDRQQKIGKVFNWGEDEVPLDLDTDPPEEIVPDKTIPEQLIDTLISPADASAISTEAEQSDKGQAALKEEIKEANAENLKREGVAEMKRALTDVRVEEAYDAAEFTPKSAAEYEKMPPAEVGAEREKLLDVIEARGATADRDEIERYVKELNELGTRGMNRDMSKRIQAIMKKLFPEVDITKLKDSMIITKDDGKG